MYNDESLDDMPEIPGLDYPTYDEHSPAPRTEARFFVVAFHDDPAARAQDVFQVSGPWINRREAESAMSRVRADWDDCDLVVQERQVEVPPAQEDN